MLADACELQRGRVRLRGTAGMYRLCVQHARRKQTLHSLDPANKHAKAEDQILVLLLPLQTTLKIHARTFDHGTAAQSLWLCS